MLFHTMQIRSPDVQQHKEINHEHKKTYHRWRCSRTR